MDMDQMRLLIDSGGSMYRAYPAFREYMQVSPAELSALTPAQFDKVIGAVILGYGGVAESLSRSKRAERSIEILELMTKLGVQPAQRSYELVLQTLSHAGDLARTEWLLKMMHTHSMQTQTASVLESLVRVYVLVRKDDAAMDCLGKAMQLDKTPAPLNTMMEALLVRGDGKLARRMFEKMQRIGPKPNSHTFEVFAVHSLRSHDPEAAIAWADLYRRTQQPLSIVLWNTMLDAANQMGEHQQAISILDEMYRLRVKFNHQTHQHRLVAFAGIKDRDMAWTIFASLLSSLKPTKSVLRAMARMESPVTADTIASVRKTIDQHGLRQFDCLLWLAAGCMELGDVASTKQLADECEMLRHRLIVSPRLRSIVASAYVKAGDVQGALRYIDGDFAATGRTATFGLYYSLLNTAIAAKSLDLAKQVIEHIKRDHPEQDVAGLEDALGMKTGS